LPNAWEFESSAGFSGTMRDNSGSFKLQGMGNECLGIRRRLLAGTTSSESDVSVAAAGNSLRYVAELLGIAGVRPYVPWEGMVLEQGSWTATCQWPVMI
jgi:hypothetical protein